MASNDYESLSMTNSNEQESHSLLNGQEDNAGNEHRYPVDSQGRAVMTNHPTAPQ